MKKVLFFVVAVLSTSMLLAQDKLLSMEDVMLKASTTFYPERLKQLQFIYGTADYTYLKKIDEKESWVRGNAKTREETIFLTLDQLNEKLTKAGYLAVASMPTIQFNYTPEWVMMAGGDKISINPVTGEVKKVLSKELVNKDFVETGNAGYTAYVEGYNLYVTDGTHPNKVTDDGSTDIVYAQSVHREEFGITKGTFWSNAGKKLAFYRMDQSMVTDYPIIDWTERPAKVNMIKYPMAGDKSHHVTVGVYNCETKATIYLQTGEPAEQYLTNIAWSPDDRFVYIAVLNRGQNHMWLNQYDASTGALVKTLFEEQDDKYTEPLVPMLFLKNNPSQFIWQSNRDGWNHLYLYDTDGKLLKQLTRGNWEVIDVKGFDSKQNLYYTSTAVSPIDRNLYQLSIKTGISRLLTPSAGVHLTQVSSDGTAVLDVYTTPTDPRTSQLIDTKNPATPKLLLQSGDPLKDYARGNLSIFTIRNAGGDSLYCREFKPVGFDPSKKYPVIVYWYGGPHAQLIMDGWNGGAGDYWFQYMAERGYIVFTLDPRGSDNRGKAFEQAIFRRAGEAQMQDLMDGIGYLKSRSYVDSSHMGLFGWSYGGFMTTDFMLNHPGIFKAAVAGGPVTNWQYYEVMYGERYMDTPQENPDGYAATNLLKQAYKLKDKLLLIHGLQDPVVVQENSVNFVKAAVDAGVQVDYMIYPGHEHNVLGKDRAHLYQKVTDYLMQYLK